MRIVEIAPWEEPVPPAKYGGTELVVYNVTEGLVEKGHEVYLLASGESKTSAKLVPIMEKSLRKMYDEKDIDAWRNYWKFAKLAYILEVINNLKPDIVHNNLNWRMILFSKFLPCPMMSTIHGPLSALNERQTYGMFPHANYVSISDNQRKAMPELNWVKTVYNGIDVNAFEFGSDERDYFAFLGRTSPEKGLKEICQTIKKTKHKLVIAAKVDSVDIPYFENEIKPHIDGDQIKFIGEVDHAGKVELLKKAKGLLLWLNWEEPFGLVVTEAMACGAPVIVNPRGSMRELVEDGKTGFLVNTLEEMAQKLDQIDSIDHLYCRNHVIQHFSKEKMVSDYIDLAKELIAKGK
jgi:glycosyltransferase involved in cell wall biosynthesis